MLDLLVKGGTVVDGTGAPARTADVAIRDGLVVDVGQADEPARRVIDADGLVVTPGFVDVHTHFDGQATWDPYVTPSSWHGVTTAIMGNCGVGFAPVVPGREEWLISVMEAVEDIPGTALSEGIRWSWETFPEYLDALDRLPHAIDLGAQVPHAAVRAYVMGERGTDDDPATDEDIAAMAQIVEESVAAGALGFSTSRTPGHMMADGRPVPGTTAADEEVVELCAALGRVGGGRGVIQLVTAGSAGGVPTDREVGVREFALIRRAAQQSGRPVTFLVLQSTGDDQWRDEFARARQARADGLQISPQVGDRCFGVLMGHQSRLNPFRTHPTYAAIASLPLAARVDQLRDPAVRVQILSERQVRDTLPSLDWVGRSTFERLFPLGRTPEYEPDAEHSIAAIARRDGRDVWEVAYDVLLRDDGRELLLLPLLNYGGGSYDALHEMMSDPLSVQGLGDGGAHSGIICDASMTTYLLSHWVLARKRGPRLALEHAVRRLTRDPAALYGLSDRGVLEPGRRADLNLIDLGALALHRPEQVNDLPAGAGRLIQRASGYASTIVAGESILEQGEVTGVLPGRLVRGGAG
ncbi:MAG: N-acyl-D-amino-acid deacylase family protein [Acidimicrobiia bacterium]